MKNFLGMLVIAAMVGGIIAPALASDELTVKLTIAGGHETDPRDHGRPVVLIAAALGVTPEVFRDAFSHVTPAPAGRSPAVEQVQQNKSALLGALGRYGVTNELLDRVSNYYRYRPESGRLWPTTPATATATLKDGRVAGISITACGAGYSSPPKISAPGHPEIMLKATLAYGRDLKTNGSITAITEPASEMQNVK